MADKRWVHNGAICLSEMVHGRPFITVLTGEQSQE